MISLTICICTCGRPEVLRRCLQSIAGGTRLPNAVLVSDDSSDDASRRATADVTAEYDFARYLEGPRHGLCANRNAVIAAVTTTHASLLDDDATVGHDFVEWAAKIAITSPDLIVSGNVLEDGIHLTEPSNQTFLGHFGRQPSSGQRLENIHLNCNLLPTPAAKAARFDESIVYGYEDCDFCAQLLAQGWLIEHSNELLNAHLPPNRAGDQAGGRDWQSERARFRVVTRRLIRWSPRISEMAAFAVLAPPHLAASAIRRGRPDRALAGWVWLATDVARALVERFAHGAATTPTNQGR